MATAPEIPLDIRELLHDCILALFWPKKKIAEFLVSVGYPEVLDTGESVTRHGIIAEAFSRLGRRPDRGYAIFRQLYT